MLGLDKALCWSPPTPRASLLTDTGLEKSSPQDCVSLRGHFAPRLFLLSTSFFDRDPSAKIRMALHRLNFTRHTVLYRLSEKTRVSSGITAKSLKRRSHTVLTSPFQAFCSYLLQVYTIQVGYLASNPSKAFVTDLKINLTMSPLKN